MVKNANIKIIKGKGLGFLIILALFILSAQWIQGSHFFRMKSFAPLVYFCREGIVKLLWFI